MYVAIPFHSIRLLIVVGARIQETRSRLEREFEDARKDVDDQEVDLSRRHENLVRSIAKRNRLSAILGQYKKREDTMLLQEAQALEELDSFENYPEGTDLLAEYSEELSREFPPVVSSNSQVPFDASMDLSQILQEFQENPPVVASGSSSQ